MVMSAAKLGGIKGNHPARQTSWENEFVQGGLQVPHQ
jgi:hypothetical protein